MGDEKTMDDLLAGLLAERAIRRQLSLYSRALDRMDVELWLSVWHVDGTLDDQVRGYRGSAAELAGSVISDLKTWMVHSHQFTTSVIEVDGDRAESESYLTVTLRGRPDRSGQIVDDHYRASCVDTWSKREGRWALDRRVVSPGLTWRQVVTDVRIGRWTRRDRQDPSYDHLASLGEESAATLEVLVAEREIRQQLLNYCRAVDRFEPDLWLSVWHDDGTLDYGGVTETGRAADLSEHMTLDHYPWASHTHLSTNSIIVVSGDRAVSETYSSNLLFARMADSDVPIDSHYRGRYLDTWSRRNGRWAVDHRWAVSDLGWDQVCLEGSLGARARRDRVDLSHALFESLA